MNTSVAVTSGPQTIELRGGRRGKATREASFSAHLPFLTRHAVAQFVANACRPLGFQADSNVELGRNVLWESEEGDAPPQCVLGRLVGRFADGQLETSPVLLAADACEPFGVSPTPEPETPVLPVEHVNGGVRLNYRVTRLNGVTEPATMTAEMSPADMGIGQLLGLVFRVSQSVQFAPTSGAAPGYGTLRIRLNESWVEFGPTQFNAAALRQLGL